MSPPLLQSACCLTATPDIESPTFAGDAPESAVGNRSDVSSRLLLHGCHRESDFCARHTVRHVCRIRHWELLHYRSRAIGSAGCTGDAPERAVSNHSDGASRLLLH